jgi:SRSO17 transposase
MLWPWELPDASVLVLSSRDALVPSELVKKQLQYGLKDGRAHKVRVLEKDLHHGYFLLFPKWQDKIISTYRDAVDESENVPVRRLIVQRQTSSKKGKKRRQRKQVFTG